MAIEQSGSATSRRYETIAVLRVTIITQRNVETLHGGSKRAGAANLRPQYLTERAAKETHHYYDKRAPQAPATFDENRAQWLVVSQAFGPVSRIYQGCFGA